MHKKSLIKIPKDITVLYSKEKKILVFIGPLKTKSFKLNIKINLIKHNSFINVTFCSYTRNFSRNKKQIKSINGTTVALIKQLLIETSAIIYQKLKFVGVGYRAFAVEKFNNKVLMFKLGYSHFLYFKTPENIKIFCLKFTKLFIFGTSYQDVNQTAALIRLYKKPEPYKGKGILYETETVILKEGKKI